MKDLLDRTGDEIIDLVDEGLARKPGPLDPFTGDPMTGDQLIAALESLPASVRARPVLLSAAGKPCHVVAVSPDAVLLTEETPF